MLRNVGFVVVGSVFCALLGCPDPEVVGHAPKAQVDEAKVRIEKAEKKAAEATAAADAVKE